MPKGLRFKDAEKARDEITNDQLKRISKMYNDWADDIAKKAEQLKRKGTMSSELQERQMKELEQALRKASEQVANNVTKILKNGMTKVCQSVIAENADWMESLGFPKDAITAAFSSVPDNVVRNIITGKIYSSGWSLSQSIWGDNEDTLAKIHEIVAGGIAENKPIYDIAKDLEQYVRPSAKKQWNLRTESGKMIYPKKVDYNAQRLARTLSQHAYQQSIKATSSENPFIQKVKWHISGNRVCEICKKRDGKVFPIDKLPMDHPNGFCIMEQLVDDNMDDRLLDWVAGKEDKELDKFAEKLGFSVDDMDVEGAGTFKIGMNIKQVPSKDKVIDAFTNEHLFDSFNEVEQGQVNAAIYEMLGIGGKPTVVDKIPDGMKTYYRGISNGEGKVNEFFEQLKNGKLYVSPSTSGNGINFANQGNEEANFDFARGFATQGGGKVDGLVVKAAFSDDMKLIKYKDLDKLVEEFRNSELKKKLLEETQRLATEMQNKAFETMDRSLFEKGSYYSKLHGLIESDERGLVAVLNGYDGVDSDTWTEYCIFNRTKLIIEKESVKV